MHVHHGCCTAPCPCMCAQSCFECGTDSDALYNSCALSCPSGPLNATDAFTHSVSSYVFLAFSAGAQPLAGRANSTAFL